MEIKLPVSVEAHAHIKVSTPFGDCDLDLTVKDLDDDGNPEIKIKWNLPGKMLDSGSDGLEVELPISALLEPLAKAALDSLESVGAPDIVVSAISAFIMDDKDAP